MNDAQLEEIINKGYEGMNKGEFNKALTFFNMAIKTLSDLSKDDVYYQKRLDEISLMANNCKVEIRKELLDKAKELITNNKIGLILEHYELILDLTAEIGDFENIEKYKAVYDKYLEIYRQNETQKIIELMNDANTFKNKGKFEKAQGIYSEALGKAKLMKNEDLVKSLQGQLDLIPVIKRKERRTKTIQMAKKAIEDQRFLLAISLYKLAAKYSAELEENDKEKEFLDEIKRIEKLKTKFEKMRKKEDSKIEGILEKAETCVEQKNYFEALRLYYKVKKLRNSNETPEEHLNVIDYSLQQYFIEQFTKNKIPEHVKDIIKLLEEMSNENENLSLVEVYNRALKRFLIPKEEISAIIYILHKIKVLL
ncbi:MAG: hypothetical protein ACTSRG_08600 [Candidatus Helarchaeota archaeon]